MHVAIGGTFDVHPDDKAAFLKIIEAVTKPSRAEPGCLRYWFRQSFEDPNKIHLFEVWKDKRRARGTFQDAASPQIPRGDRQAPPRARHQALHG